MRTPADPGAAALRFTVVIPAFRSEETIGRAVQSVLDQTLPVHEVLVVDDGSDDGTAAAAGAFGPPVRVLHQPNGGTASARNHGVREATGDVLCFLDADDTYAPGRLEQIAAKLAAEPELDGVMTDALLVWPDREERASQWMPEGVRLDRLDLRAKIIFCALAIRTRAMREAGTFDARFHRLEDVEFWHRLICRGYRIGWVGEPSYEYRINPAGKTQSGGIARGEHELSRIFRRYAVAPRTPHAWRPRLLVRALRHERRALKAALERR